MNNAAKHPDTPTNVRVNRSGNPVKDARHTINGARSMVRNLPRRANAGEMNEADLAALAALAGEVEAAMVATIAVFREQGSSWADIGATLGLTRQGAQQRYGKAVAS